MVVLIAIFGLLSVPAYSQLKNMILLEEATNASCGPCAGQNPVLEQFLQDHSADVIAVSYHAWWPGLNDPMYVNDKAMNEARITYYGFDQIGVPVCVIGGSYATPVIGYAGAPGDTDAVIVAVDSEMTVARPITMDVKRYVQSDSEEVLVVLRSTSAFTNATLRVVVAEGMHEYTDAGDNGETVFHNIARKMLPSSTGKKFSLAAGATTTFTYKYKYNPAWTTSELRIVAFVQLDKDKSVIAAVQTVDPPVQGFPSRVASADAAGFSMRVTGTPMSAEEKVNYTLMGNEPMKVTFSVIDLLGREMQPSRFELVSPGSHIFDLHPSALAAGMYTVIARTPGALVQVPVLIGK